MLSVDFLVYSNVSVTVKTMGLHGLVVNNADFFHTRSLTCVG